MSERGVKPTQLLLTLRSARDARVSKHANAEAKTTRVVKRALDYDEVAAPPPHLNHPLRHSRALGGDCVLSDLLDRLHLVQGGHAMVRVAAGLFPEPADARQLPQRLVRRRGIRRHA